MQGNGARVTFPRRTASAGAASGGLIEGGDLAFRAADPKIYNVLFLMDGQLIFAEAALHRWGQDRFVAYSAGSHPAGAVHPATLSVLKSMRQPTEMLRSKSWDEFVGPTSPPLDFVFTVCDKAAGEACPVWPGSPVTAHWGVEDPAGFVGSAEKQRLAFEGAYRQLENRVKLFVNLRIEDLDEMSLRRSLDEIGRTELP